MERLQRQITQNPEKRLVIFGELWEVLRDLQPSVLKAARPEND